MKQVALPSYVISQVKAANDEIQRQFGSLTAEQLNWKANPKSWSIAQCIDHLRVTNLQYMPKLEPIIAGTYEPNFWAKRGLFSGAWGRMLINATSPVPDKKGKTIPSFEPSKSDLPATIVKDFDAHINEFCSLIEKLPARHLDGILLNSPAAKFITYSLKDTLTVLGNHHERHLYQANAVLKQQFTT